METFLLIFAVIAILGLLSIKPRLSLLVLSFSLPFIGWSFYVGSLSLPLVDLVAFISLIAFFLNRLFSIFFGKGGDKLKSLRWPVIFPLGIFLILVFLSSLLSSSPVYSLWYTVRWPFFMYLAYIFLPYNLIESARDLKAAAMSILLSSTLVLASGYFSLWGQDWYSSFFRLKSLSLSGIYPFGENHNLIAEFLNVGTFLILMLRSLTKKERMKRLWGIAFVISCLAVILTFSRAGWITLALQLAIYVWVRFRSKKEKPLNLILGAIALMVLLSPIFWRMSTLQADNTSSTENRWLLTEISWQAFLEKPILGQGSGQFVNLVSDNLRFTAKYGEAIDSHGMLQKILAENGALGLAAWLFIIIILVRLSIRALKRYPANRHWLLPLFLAGFGGLFFQLFNTSYYKGKVWLPIALGLAAIRLLEEKRHKNKSDE